MSQRTFQLSVLALLLTILAIGVLILVTLRASQSTAPGSSVAAVTSSPGQSALEATREYFDAAAAGDLGRYLAVVEIGRAHV